MSLLHGIGEFFSMDIGTNVIRMVQLNGDYDTGWSLQKYAYMPVPTKIMQDSSERGRNRLGEIIVEAVSRAGITTKNVAVGMPARKTYTAVITLPTMPLTELEQTLVYQVEQHIPSSIEKTKVDYSILGPLPHDPVQTEVLLSSADKTYAEEMMNQIESLGFNVIAQEPDPIAICRSLLPSGAASAQVIIDLGEKSTDLVIAYASAPRLIRSISLGISSFIKTLAATLSIREDQARQFLLKFGLAQDKLEGQVFRVLDTSLEVFANEIQRSVRFFQSKYPGVQVGGVILSGFAGSIPFVPEYIEAKLGIPSFQGNPWQLVRVDSAQQKALMNVASEFSVAIGLAEREN